ncbi:hypothetical protein L6452_43467 [Arctium lappa]|uniref:Uncharacterized protein n=1 Tax=Arctium lappa TaxID=4217 RepID=A0ACB8XD09_ARCLA|nr:hypothetical protein L6452_43467 [Arctium lappa]
MAKSRTGTPLATIADSHSPAAPDYRYPTLHPLNVAFVRLCSLSTTPHKGILLLDSFHPLVLLWLGFYKSFDRRFPPPRVHQNRRRFRLRRPLQNRSFTAARNISHVSETDHSVSHRTTSTATKIEAIATATPTDDGEISTCTTFESFLAFIWHDVFACFCSAMFS